MTVLDRFALTDRVAVVTGASSGLGVAFAVAMAEAGADVVVAARRPDLLETTAELVRATGRRCLVIATDVTDPNQCEALAEAAVNEFGSLDILINNAGKGSAVPALKETPAQFWDVVTVNIGGVYYTAQACARRMRPGSVIVNVASIGAYVSFGTPQAAYQASKSAVVGLTRDLAQQWTGRRGIRVVAIAPGFVRTDLTTDWFDKGGFDSHEGPLIPMGRPGTPDEIAASVVFLASDAAAYMTGSVLIVDGGRTVF